MPVPFPADISLDDAEWTAVAAEKVLFGTPKFAYKIFYSSSTEELTAGFYACTSGKWKIDYTEDEFCTLTQGTVRLTRDGGETKEFSAPASFLIPAGFKGTWEPLTELRKFFVIYERAK